MTEHDHCKTQMNVCSRIFGKDIKRIEDRFLATDRALEVQAKELERRMHEANNIKTEFTKTMLDLQLQVGNLESNSALWMKVIGFALVILQIIIGVALKYSIK